MMYGDNGGGNREDLHTRLAQVEVRAEANEKRIDETRGLVFRLVFALLVAALAYGAGVTYLLVRVLEE